MNFFRLLIALSCCVLSSASACGDEEDEHQSFSELIGKTMAASKSTSQSASFSKIKEILTSARVGDPNLLMEGRVLEQQGSVAAICAAGSTDDDCKLYSFDCAKAIMEAFPVNVTRVVVMLFDCHKHETKRIEFRKTDITRLSSQSSNTEKILQATTFTIHPIFADYGRSLLGEYQLIRNNFKEVVIARPQNGLSIIALYGNVQKLAIKEPYVTGFTLPFEGDKNHDKRTGYFLLDTQNHKLKPGLTEEDWRTNLQQVNWSNPNLIPPPMYICDPL